MTPTITAEHLFRASDILDETGWCRGARTNENGEHCLLGAVDAAYQEIEGQRPMIDNREVVICPSRDYFPELELAFTEAGLFGVNMSEFGFNDSVAKSKKQVQSKLRRMARILAKREKGRK